MSIDLRTPETPAHPKRDERPRVDGTALCPPAEERECGWTSPWRLAAQNADWCIPEVRP